MGLDSTAPRRAIVNGRLHAGQLEYCAAAFRDAAPDAARIVIRVGNEMLRITHYMYFDDQGDFQAISRHISPRFGKRFVDDQVATSPDVAP